MEHPLRNVDLALQPPLPKYGIRVLKLGICGVKDYGAGSVDVNPWVDVSNLPWPVPASTAEDLTSRGLPLSLSDVLTRDLGTSEQLAALTYLLALVKASDAALDQLNSQRKIPLIIAPRPNRQGALLAATIERLCKTRLGSAPIASNSQAWTSWASSYEVWIHDGEERLAKVGVRGVDKGSCAYDLGGVHLTGGRVWAGALILIRWVCSILRNSPLIIGDGPVLEVGAGIGIAGIAIAKLGKRVVLSDREPALLDQMRSNVEDNDVQDVCRVFDFDWESLGLKKMQRFLAAQRFSAVVGSDVIYNVAHAQLLAKVLRYALPSGGIAFLVNARKHREGIDAVGPVMREAGYDVLEGKIPCVGHLQQSLCGIHEPDQEYFAFTVRVPPMNMPPENLCP